MWYYLANVRACKRMNRTRTQCFVNRHTTQCTHFRTNNEHVYFPFLCTWKCARKHYVHFGNNTWSDACIRFIHKRRTTAHQIIYFYYYSFFFMLVLGYGVGWWWLLNVTWSATDIPLYDLLVMYCCCCCYSRLLCVVLRLLLSAACTVKCVAAMGVILLSFLCYLFESYERSQKLCKTCVLMPNVVSIIHVCLPMCLLCSVLYWEV